MNTTITQHGIFQLVRSIAELDPRVRACHYWDALTIDPKAIELPALVFRYGQVRVDQSVILATFHLIAFDHVLPDRSNVALIPSELTTLLLDIHNHITRNVEAWALGIIPEGTPVIETAPDDEEATIKAQALAFTLKLPDAACLTSLGYSPIDLSGSGYAYSGSSVSNGSAFSCADLSGCELIQTILADIAAHDVSIATLSGTTATHTTQIAELYTLTGGTTTIGVDFLPLSGGTGGPYTFTGQTTADELNVMQALYLWNQIPGAVQFIRNDFQVNSDPSNFYFDESTSTLSATHVTGVTIGGGVIMSGQTDLQELFPSATYVQPGSNITTGGTPSRPTVNVSATPSFTTVSATTFVENGSALSGVYAPISVVPTYAQPGLNITTGGTASRPIVNLGGSISLTAVTAPTVVANTSLTAKGTNDFSNSSNSIHNTTWAGSMSQPTTFTSGVLLLDRAILLVNDKSDFSAATANGTRFVVQRLGEFTEGLRVTGAVSGTTFYSGSTELGSLFAASTPTYVQPGLNITTGGTSSRPVVHLAGTLTITAMTASDFVNARTLSASTTVTSANFVSGSTNLSSVFAPISVIPTYVQPAANIVTGGTASRPTVGLSPNIALASISATTITATTYYDGNIAQANVTSVVLGSNFTTSANTLVDVTGLSVPVAASSSYTFRFVIAFQSTNTSTGAGFAFNGPSSPSVVTARMESHQSAGSLNSHQTGYNQGTAGANVASASASYTATLEGVLVTTGGGDLQLRALRGGSANNIVVMSGSSVVLTKLT